VWVERLWSIAELERLLGDTQTRTSALVSDLSVLRDTQDKITALQNEAVLFLLACAEDARQQWGTDFFISQDFFTFKMISGCFFIRSCEYCLDDEY
jgi:hypothetical protein